jgi:hypothetical protein
MPRPWSSHWTARYFYACFYSSHLVSAVCPSTNGSGICVVAPATLHLLLVAGWIARAVGRFGTATLRTRINVFLNLGLLALLALELLSGILISRVALPRLGLVFAEDRAWRSLHNEGLNFLVLMLGLHIALNWTWIIGTVKRRWSGASFAIPQSAGQLLRVAAGLFITSAIIAALAWNTIGAPSIEREYRQNEIARFEPAVRHGLVQFSGEAMLVGAVAFVARKWLRLRL